MDIGRLLMASGSVLLLYLRQTLVSKTLCINNLFTVATIAIGSIISVLKYLIPLAGYSKCFSAKISADIRYVYLYQILIQLKVRH